LVTRTICDRGDAHVDGVPDTAREKRSTGHANVTSHREGRKAEVPLGGPHQILDAHIIRRACEELGLDWSELPGPKSRV
jgi:hypothetical protein